MIFCPVLPPFFKYYFQVQYRQPSQFALTVGIVKYVDLILLMTNDWHCTGHRLVLGILNSEAANAPHWPNLFSYAMDFSHCRWASSPWPDIKQRNLVKATQINVKHVHMFHSAVMDHWHESCTAKISGLRHSMIHFSRAKTFSNPGRLRDTCPSCDKTNCQKWHWASAWLTLGHWAHSLMVWFRIHPCQRRFQVRSSSSKGFPWRRN